MSLRLRLTLVYSGMLSGVVLLLSIVVYALVSLLFTDFVDNDLQDGATQIISYLRADGIGGMQIGSDPLPISDDYFYQIWSTDRQLLDYSVNASDFISALDDDSLSQDELRFSEATIDQVLYRVITVPLEVQGQPYGWLQVGLTLTEIRYTLGLLQVVFGISAMFAIVVSVMVGWIVIGQALSPLVTMADIAKQITSMDDLSQRIPVSAGWSGEIGDLVLTFNQTFVRLERLFHTQRRFLADVSHELRTPLTVIKGNVGLMRLMKSFDEESLTSIEREVNRLTRLVGDLLLMAQAEAGQLPLALVSVEIDELLFEVFDEIKVISGGKHVIRIGDIEPVVVMGDRDRLKQVLLNLGVNAVNYTPEGGGIELKLGTRGDWVEIVVSDEGRGIPKEELGSLFERFYRGEKSRTRSVDSIGFGLGLPIAYWIVRSHGGRIDVETQEGQGTTFTVWLPRSQQEIPTRSQKNRKESI
jgi:two-component system, OmpR family, sensor kinase